MRRTLGALVLLVAVSGCKDTSKTTAAASASVTAKPSATAKLPPPPTPAALDVKGLEKALKCGANGHGPCKVLRQFKDCKSWLPLTDSGDGRWVGMAHIVNNGLFAEELRILRSKRVNVGDVGPGQLNAKIAITDIPTSYPAEEREARRALRAYKRGDVPKKINVGVRYIKDRSNWPDAFSMKAKENQIYVADGGGMYLCQMQADQRLLVIRKPNNPKKPGDGIYAEMYPVSW